MGADVADDPEMKPHRCILQTLSVLFCCLLCFYAGSAWRNVSQNHVFSMLGFASVSSSQNEVILELTLSSGLCPFPFEIPTFNFHSRNPSVLQLVLQLLYCSAYSLQASTSNRLCFNLWGSEW